MSCESGACMPFLSGGDELFMVNRQPFIKLSNNTIGANALKLHSF